MPPSVNPEEPKEPQKRKRGFAAMDPARHKAVAQLGGKGHSGQGKIQQREPTGIHRRGFASLSDERKRELASLGGKAAHQQGRGHRWTPAEASAAGRIGGRIGGRQPRRRRSQPAPDVIRARRTFLQRGFSPTHRIGFWLPTDQVPLLWQALASTPGTPLVLHARTKASTSGTQLWLTLAWEPTPETPAFQCWLRQVISPLDLFWVVSQPIAPEAHRPSVTTQKAGDA